MAEAIQWLNDKNKIIEKTGKTISFSFTRFLIKSDIQIVSEKY